MSDLFFVALSGSIALLSFCSDAMSWRVIGMINAVGAALNFAHWLQR